MEAVVGTTVVKDMDAAASLGQRISDYQGDVRKAEKTYPRFAGAGAHNVNTKFQLDLWAASLQETDRNLGDFQSFYSLAKTGHARLLGMAHAFVGSTHRK
jgi:hypothetical protein